MDIKRNTQNIFIGRISIIYLLLFTLSCNYKNHSGVSVILMDKILKTEEMLGLKPFANTFNKKNEIRIYNFHDQNGTNEYKVYVIHSGIDTISIYKNMNKNVILPTTAQKKRITKIINQFKPYEFMTTDSKEIYGGEGHYMVSTYYINFNVSYFYIEMLNNNDNRKKFIHEFFKIIFEKS